MTESFQAGLRRAGLDVDLFVETLDVNRFDEQFQSEPFAEFLRTKYANQSLDAILALGPASLEFLAEHAATLFQGAAIVYSGVPSSSVPSRERLPNTTGVISRFELVGTLQLAVRLQPSARDIVVVTGTAPLDVIWYGRARERLAAYEDLFDVTYLAGLSKQELLERLGALPGDTIVLLLTTRRDSEGAYLMEGPSVVSEISAASSAPVYGPYDAYVGDGAVGGRVESFEEIGEAVATAVARIAGGERAADVPVVQTAEQFVVDWRQLQRWNLDEARLPAGTIVRFRGPSLWTQYRSVVLAALAIVSLQALTIVALLLHIRKRRVERQLHETEDRYRKVVESQTDLICRYLPDTTLTFVNDAYCLFFNRKREELLGKQFAYILDEPDRTRAFEHVRSLADRPRRESHLETSERPDGSPSWQRWVDNPILDASGRVVEIQSIGHDVTDLKLAEQEARQRREQVTHLTRVAVLGELSGALAHELQQPITAVLNNAQVADYLLSREPPDLQEIKEIVQDIIADDMRAGEVISRLRSLLKPGTHAFGTFDVQSLIADVVTLVRGQLAERRVELVQRLSSDLPPITGDRVQLQQVLLNLFLNGCDAMSATDPADRVLTVEAERADRFVRVAVRDNGSGLAPDIAARLFEPFVTTKPNGLGLGLSICRSIIRAHGGGLAARNNPDRGATFEFTVPVAGAGRDALQVVSSNG